MENNTKVKCSKVRKCKWKGMYSELVDVPVNSEYVFEVTEKCCPKCGHNEFYEVEVK